MFRSLRGVGCLVLLAGLPFVAACGVRESKLAESGATLTGAITFQGNPIEFAQVTVLSADGKSSMTGKVLDNGKYKVENAPLGEVKIAVNTMAARGDFESKTRSQNAAAMDPNASKKISAPKFTDVPTKYYDAANSGIKTTVKEGENTFDIKLE